jgi:hypothetical protein
MKDKTFCIDCKRKINTKDSCINDEIGLNDYRCKDCFILCLEKMKGGLKE